jgi:hypothetical protein
MGSDIPIALEFARTGDFFMTVGTERRGGYAGLAGIRQWYRVEPESNGQNVTLTIHSKLSASADKNLLHIGKYGIIQPVETWEIEPPGDDFNQLKITRTRLVPETIEVEVKKQRMENGRLVIVPMRQQETVYRPIPEQVILPRVQRIGTPMPAPMPAAPPQPMPVEPAPP